MNQLYLFRHGIALPHGTPDIADDDRPLTSKGERRVREVSYGIKKLKPKLDKIVTSPLPRAYRTAEILARVLGQPDLLETADALRAGESASAIASWLESRSEDRLMIVGHNPSLTDLIGLLVLGECASPFCELRKGGLAALSKNDLNPNRMTLDWIARPRLIRRLADR